MRRAQTIWRPSLASVTLGLGLFWLSLSMPACESSHRHSQTNGPSRPDFRKPVPANAASPEGAPTAHPSALPSAVVQTLQTLHEQRLELQPPDPPPQLLAFGPGRLLQASLDHVVLRDTAQGDSLSDANIGTALALAHGSDGALFAIGGNSGVRFESRAQKGRAFPHAAFFPGSTLFADLERRDFFYVYYPGEHELLRYAFESEAGAILPIDASIPLEGCVTSPTQLRDGALACRTQAGFARKAPRGARTDFNAPTELGQPLRLLPARRLDELYSVDRAGKVEQVRLAVGVPVLSAFQLQTPPYAAAANGEALAFVVVSPPEVGKPRRWSLLVTNLEGQPRMQVELVSPPAPAEEDWAKIVTLDKNLAISEYEPLVAVGGAAHVAVWDYREAKLRFER
jgi:hypothetical protein